MEEKLKRTWRKLIVIIYFLSMICLIVAISATGYALSHPELRLFEQDQQVRNNIANFGLTLGILVTFLQRLFFWVGLPFVVLVVFWYDDRKNKEFTRLGTLIYSGGFAFGLTLLTMWFVDALNDLSVLFFSGSPAWVSSFLDLPLLVLPLLLFVIYFLLVLCVFHLIVRKMVPLTALASYARGNGLTVAVSWLP